MADPPPIARVPEFDLPALTGGRLALDALLRDGPVWLIFMKSSCQTCRMTAPLAERAQRLLGGKSGSIVFVMQDTPAAAREFAEGFDLTVPVAVEESPYAVSESYEIATVPTYFLVEPDRSIARYSAGFIRDHWQETAGDLAGQAGIQDYEFTGGDKRIPAMKPG